MDKARLNQLGLKANGDTFRQSLNTLTGVHWIDENLQRAGTGNIQPHQPDAIARELNDNEMLALIPGYAIKSEHTAAQYDVPFVAVYMSALIVKNAVYIPGPDATKRFDRKLGKRDCISPETAMALITAIPQR